jgi:hypothetical protein
MANIPGLVGYNQPDVFDRIRTLRRATSIPGGLRVLSIIGEGQRNEVIVDSAKGGGQDGFTPDFTQASDSYGRFFRTSVYPLVPNRSALLLNDAPLRILEEAIDLGSFPSEFDARLDPDTGEIELQAASLVDQGGQFYRAGTGNIGDGYLASLQLVDSNAPAETWTIRCSSVLRDSYGAPRRGQASFVVSGSVSGQLLDAYGQPFIWRSDGIVVSNTVLSFAIFNPTGAALDIGDRFTVMVSSRVLQERDHLEADYIAEQDLNDPETFTDPAALYLKHGQPSLANTLSLGAQMAFENGATSVLAVQALPPLPRRTSEIVLPARNAQTGQGGATGHNNVDDLVFFITSPGKPDSTTQVHFFVIGTDGNETQIFPNKVSFYDPTVTAALSHYEDTGDDTQLMSDFMDPGQTGMPFSYTVVSDDKVKQTGTDGYVSAYGLNTGTFYSPSVEFTSDDVGGYMDFINADPSNEGRFGITAVIDQNTARITRVSGSFTAETGVRWQLLSGAGLGTSQRILVTTDLALAVGQGLRVTYIDIRDASFYDANWSESITALGKQDAQILVPLPTQTFSAIQQAFRVHVEQMSSIANKRERVLFTGALDGLTVDNVTGVSETAVENIGILEGIQGDNPEDILAGNIEDLSNYDVAVNFGDTFRVVYFYPDEIVRVVAGSQQVLPGYYIAAAAGGRVAGTANIAEPLTFKILSGFTILNSRIFTQDQLNRLGDHGITVLQPVSGGARVLHGKTTTQSGAPEEEEISIVFIRDQIARVMRQGFRAFIGQPEDPTLIPSLTATAISLLNAFVSQNLITKFANLSVARDDVEPRQFNIRCEVQPSYPINWIFVDVSVGLF